VVREPLRYLHPCTDPTQLSRLVNPGRPPHQCACPARSAEAVPRTNIAADHRPVPDRDAGRPRKSTAPATAPSEQGRRRVLASIAVLPRYAAAACTVWCTGVERGDRPRRSHHHILVPLGKRIRPARMVPDDFRTTGYTTRHPFHLLLFFFTSNLRTTMVYDSLFSLRLLPP
jgi:hypothetical protein